MSPMPDAPDRVLRPVHRLAARAAAAAALPARHLLARHRHRADGGRRAPARRRHQELLGCARRRGHRRCAERGDPARARRAAVAAHARARLPARPDRRRAHPPARRRPDGRRAHGRQLRLGAARRARGRRGERRARGVPRLRRHVVDPDREPDRPPAGDHRQHRRPGNRLPRDRRARAARAAPRDARRQRADDGALAGRRLAPAGRVGDRPLLADRRQPGGDPARLERGHLRVPLGREGDGDADDLLGAAGLRRARAAARNRHRPAHRRRREPRQPPLRRGGRGDPHRQPDGRGEEVQSGLSGVLRERRQRDAHARPLRLGGVPRVDGRAACDPPRRAGRAATAAASTR